MAQLQTPTGPTVRRPGSVNHAGWVEVREVASCTLVTGILSEKEGFDGK